MRSGGLCRDKSGYRAECSTGAGANIPAGYYRLPERAFFGAGVQRSTRVLRTAEMGSNDGAILEFNNNQRATNLKYRKCLALFTPFQAVSALIFGSLANPLSAQTTVSLTGGGRGDNKSLKEMFLALGRPQHRLSQRCSRESVRRKNISGEKLKLSV